ncbi:unnamed protein product, partial [Schistocephalus solidus]|uniref:Uncharacterized protein n=1 Tax=Schistocephalus solidus TaxID=70667 RepID=A0A183TMM1_SCHSO
RNRPPCKSETRGANVCGTPYPAEQHLLPPSDVGEGHVDARSIAALAAAGLYSRPEVTSTGSAGYQGNPRCRWLDGSPPRPLQDEAPTSTPPNLPSVIQSNALEVLGRARLQHQDCFHDQDAHVSNLLMEKKRLHKACLKLRINATKAAFFRCHRLVQQRLLEIQDTWMICKAEEIQGSVLNCSSAITNVRLPQVDKNTDLDLPPSLPETIRAVQQISNEKAPGSDAIPPAAYKHGGPRLMAELVTIFQEMWRQGKIP